MADPKTKAFPVKLNKNYRPQGKFQIQQVDPDTEKTSFRDPLGAPEKDGTPATDEFAKVPRGATVLLPIDEAKELIEKKIADRADAIPD